MIIELKGNLITFACKSDVHPVKIPLPSAGSHKAGAVGRGFIWRQFGPKM